MCWCCALHPGMCEEQRRHCERSGQVNEWKDEQSQKPMAPSVHHQPHKAKIWAPGRQKDGETATEMRHLLFLLSLKILSRVHLATCCFGFSFFLPCSHTVPRPPAQVTHSPRTPWQVCWSSTDLRTPQTPHGLHLIVYGHHLPSQDLVTQSDMHVCILYINYLYGHINNGNSGRDNLPNTYVTSGNQLPSECAILLSVLWMKREDQLAHLSLVQGHICGGQIGGETATCGGMPTEGHRAPSGCTQFPHLNGSLSDGPYKGLVTCVLFMYFVYLYVTCVHVSKESRRGGWIPCSWNDRRLWGTEAVLDLTSVPLETQQMLLAT